MNLKIRSEHIEDFLCEIPPIIVFSGPKVQDTILSIEEQSTTNRERAKLAFEFARDQIGHSFDLDSELITINAEDAIDRKEGICFAKSHVLAALLRGMKIPAGFCYQRVVRKGTVESGHALHGLNALYLEEYGWFRLDPRGNKLGIDSQFSTDEEKLAYPIRKELGEIDYPDVFATPLPTVVSAMRETKDCRSLFFDRPDTL
jgi:transglutaminase-like putative cysteine protease